jgi:hypothetical protein
MVLPLISGQPKPTSKAVQPAKEAKVQWDGEWSLVPSQSDRIDERIEAHLQDQNFAMKLFWKRKLQSACRSFDKLDILAGDGFSVTMGRERPIDTPADGTENPWKRSDDVVFKATLAAEGRTMTQTLVGDGYTLTYAYIMRKDGDSLALQVTYAHPKLETPFSYKWVFKRND